MQIKLSRALNGNSIIQDGFGLSFVEIEQLLAFTRVYSLQAGTFLVIEQAAIESLEEKTLQLIDQEELNHIIIIGQKAEIVPLDTSVIYFETEDEFIRSGLFETTHDKYFMLKGNKRFLFDKSLGVFSRRSHKTALMVDLEQISQNVRTFRQKLSSGTKLMVMVKAFAYGAGGVEISKWLQHQLVDYLAVAFIDEGIELRQNGIELPIMVMSPGVDDAHLLKKYDLEPEVYDLRQLVQYVENYQVTDQAIPIHIMINTGMNRLGFDEDQIDDLIRLIKSNEQVQVKSLMTHLAAADNIKERVFTVAQNEQFMKIARQLETSLHISPLLHSLNSSGIRNYPEYQLDMVRLGIGMHGVGTDEKTKLRFPASLKTTITQIRNVPKGATIGYGRVGKANKPLRIATIPIGYADGYLRAFGNGNAYVTINGEKVRTIGSICMDMTMLDITGIDVQIEDEVTLFGSSPTIEELAEWSATIPYEIITNISSRVQRVFYR